MIGIRTPESRGSDENRSLREETDPVFRQLLDQMAVIILTLGTISILLSVMRAGSVGWHQNIILDIITFIPLLILLLLRRYIPWLIMTWLLLIIVGIGALANLFTLGLATVSLVMLTACCTMIGLFFNLGAGLWSLGITLTCAVTAGFLTSKGLLSPDLDFNHYLQDSRTWSSQLSAYAVIVVALLVSVHRIKTKLWQSLLDVRNKSRDIQEREEKYRILSQNMQDVLFIQDMDMRVMYASPSVEKVFGYTVDAVKKMNMPELMTAESLDRAITGFHKYSKLAVKQNVEVPLFEFEYIRKDGSTFWGELKPVFLRDENGHLVGSQGIIRDITARKKAAEKQKELENQLIQSEKLRAIGELAGGIAHDFNNQLAGIIGAAELLRMNNRENPDLAHFADNILIPAKRAADLTSKLLAFARKGDMHSEIFDVHTIINEVIHILNRSIDKTISISDTLNASPSTVTGDPGQIENAILNIALNARDAMPGGGTLTFQTSTRPIPQTWQPEKEPAPKEMVAIQITDTGIGMDDAVLNRVFEPFFTTKPASKGTGMGMAAVYGTIQSHNGTIDIHSSPGKGTTVTVCLPVSDNLPGTGTQSGSVSSLSGTGSILILDDEEMVRKVTAGMLESLGFRVHTASDGKEAIRYFETSHKKTDLVLLDLVLPEMSGSAVFEALRKIDPDVRILLFSGYSEEGDATMLLKKGARGFLRKPFSLNDLADAVKKAMGKSR